MWGQRQQEKGDMARGIFPTHLPSVPLAINDQLPHSQPARNMSGTQPVGRSSAQSRISTLRLPRAPLHHFLPTPPFPVLQLCKGKTHMPDPGLRVPTKPGLSPGSDAWAGQQVNRAKRTRQGARHIR